MKFYLEFYNPGVGVSVARHDYGEEFIGAADDIAGALTLIAGYKKKPNSPDQRVVIETETQQ